MYKHSSQIINALLKTEVCSFKIAISYARLPHNHLNDFRSLSKTVFYKYILFVTNFLAK